MNNGSGLRVTLFVSGCDHYCSECQNPQTWDKESGIEFDQNALDEIMYELSHDYISGITLSGGDPLYEENIETILNLCKSIKEKFPTKTIWVYTGFLWEDIYLDSDLTMLEFVTPFQLNRKLMLDYIDVLVDGEYVKELSDVTYHWAGSTNQRVINVKKALEAKEIVLYDEVSI